MGNFWHDLTKWLEDASNVVGREAGDLTLKGRLKLEIFELNRKLRDDLVVFGIMAYEGSFVKKNPDWQKDKKVLSFVKKIKARKNSLKKKEAEYKRVGKVKRTTKRKTKKKI